MKLFDIIASAQGGRAFANMGQAYGVGEEVAAQTVRYFVPAIAKAIEKRSQSAAGLLSVLEFLGSRRFDRFLGDSRVFGHNHAIAEGERVLNFLFLTAARIDKIVDRRAQVLPLPATQLRKMLPVIAILAMGAIEVRTRRPLVAILQKITHGASDGKGVDNPYIVLAQRLRKLEREDKDRSKWRLFGLFGTGGTGSGPGRQPAEVEPPAAAPAPPPAQPAEQSNAGAAAAAV